MGRVKRVAIAIAAAFALSFVVSAPAVAGTNTVNDPGMYCC